MTKRHVRFIRRLSSLILNVLACLFVAIQPADSQIKSAELFGSPTMQTDYAAHEVLANLVQVSGGEAAWKAVRSAEMKVSLVTSASVKPVTLILLDDWSTPKALYRRGFIGQKSQPRDHTGETTFKTNRNGTGKVVPEFDQARLLADHLPAAAAEVILRKHGYAIRMSTDTRCPSDTECIDVYRKNSPDAPYLKEQQWEISKATGLAKHVKIRLPNLAHPERPMWSMTSYVTYTTVKDLIVPSVTQVELVKGKPQEFHLISLEPGVSFDVKNFDQELVQ